MEINSPHYLPKTMGFLESMPEPFTDDLTDTNGLGDKYVGYAQLGVSETEEGWRISKTTVEIDAGTGARITKTLYANSSMLFSFSWALRDQYEYGR